MNKFSQMKQILSFIDLQLWNYSFCKTFHVRARDHDMTKSPQLNESYKLLNKSGIINLIIRISLVMEAVDFESF